MKDKIENILFALFKRYWDLIIICLLVIYQDYLDYSIIQHIHLLDILQKIDVIYLFDFIFNLIIIVFGFLIICVVASIVNSIITNKWKNIFEFFSPYFIGTINGKINSIINILFNIDYHLFALLMLITFIYKIDSIKLINSIFLFSTVKTVEISYVVIFVLFIKFLLAINDANEKAKNLESSIKQFKKRI